MTATVAAAGSVATARAQGAQFSLAARRPESPNMIYRTLGRTGEQHKPRVHFVASNFLHEYASKYSS